MNNSRNYPGLEGKCILIVEDVELNQQLAKLIMERWGCIVEIAGNGNDAVEKIKNADFDLILMDIQMPVMDGMEATKFIRDLDDKKKAGVPIVALTANAMKTDCESYLKLGMNDCVAKPFEEPRLYKTIERNINKRKAINYSDGAFKQQVHSANGKLYDLSMVEAISGGDRSFILRMLQLFLDTAPVTLAEIKSSCDRSDWLALSRHAHKLKSTIDSMNILSLKQDIRSIETGGKNGEMPARLRELTDNVLNVMARVMEEVKSELEIRV